MTANHRRTVRKPGHTATTPVDDVIASESATDAAVLHRSHVSAQQTDEDDRALVRIVDLPRDVGWMMVSVGVLGVILPGLPGTPFLIAGIAVLAPGGPRLLTRWARRKPKGVVHTGLKQIVRWLDDLERRYPRLPSNSL
jgi:hypothetical protein